MNKKINFRIPGHDCVTLISCSRSPAVTTLIIKFKKKKCDKKYFERNKFDGVGIELVLPQSCTPAVEKKKEILHGYRTSVPTVLHSRSWKKKKYYMVIELVLPQSRTPTVEKKEILHGYTTSAPALPHSRSRKKKRNITWL